MTKIRATASASPPSDESSDLYMTAEQVAQALSVTLATVYVYVSRKLIRSEAIPGTRIRRYWQPDVERLQKGKVTNKEVTNDKLLSSETRITLLSETGIYYRGKDAVELSKNASFEDVVGLLWEADVNTLFSQPVPAPIKSLEQMLVHTRGWSAVDRAISLFPLIEREDFKSYDLTHAAYTRTGVDVLRWFIAFTLGLDHPVEGKIHEVLAKRLKAPKNFEEVIRQALVLSADHQIEPLTYAIRAIANVGVTPYKAALAGLIASQGQRVQADRQMARFIDEIVTAPNGSTAVVSRIRAGEPLPGFGNSMHTVDPRTQAMMAAFRAWKSNDTDVVKLQQALDCAAEITDASPRFILPATLVGRKLGLIGQELAIASIGRMAGWLAHAYEQQEISLNARPHATYIGTKP